MATQGNQKRKNGRNQVEEALAGATEKVLKHIRRLYESGLAAPGEPGALGLTGIAASPLVKYPLRKPRKKITVMIVGNHSAGKSSFINWYIGEGIQKTGVAIETRGFTFVTSGKKRETLTGDATEHFFDFLKDSSFGQIEGMKSNLFTEISTSQEKNFICTDLIDTPGLVDGDMQYPFDVQDAIVQMAEHVDLILIFFDPIGQATCKRTMQVVERLNNSPHLEKIHYFMSKADAVDKEHDRQRVLIQITQNLATRIRNSHAFALPTFYLPREDGSDTIPNAIEDVCKEIDKSINMTVQKNMRQLKEDCDRLTTSINDGIVADKAMKGVNTKAALRGSLLYFLAACTLAFIGLLITARILPSVCEVSDFGLCKVSHAQLIMKLQPAVAEHFNLMGGVLLVLFVALAVMAKMTFKLAPVFTKKDLKKLDEYRALVKSISQQEKDLYNEYFKAHRHQEK